ncbi:MAG TPA: 2Fe-2S iron-sulfur cluster-binding protein, partial [Ktedonobacterales bacterium]|nr:2Fe-2S iron-sulfur cluster-binding protein [Ktedonobacterales bacterium]
SAFSRSSQMNMSRLPQDTVVRSPQDNMTQALPLAAPTNMLPVQVINRQVIAPDVVSVQIVLPGTNQAPAPYLSGQFVTLALPTARETLYRSYSLCGDGDPSRPWELTIKRMQSGAVSTYFYQSVQQGTLLYASLPRGTFTLPGRLTPEMAFVFVATGSGITPIMGMLRSIRRMPAQERPLVQLHYASRTPDDIIYGDELDAMDPDRIWLRQLHYVSSEGYRMTVDDVLDYAGSTAVRAHWYMCGADNLKQELQTELEAMGVPVRQIHTEVFGSQHGPAYRIGQAAVSTESTDLFIADTGDALNVEPGETLLAALERNGYHPDFSCRAGICGSCKLRMLEGEVDQPGEILSPTEKASGYVLSCIAHPKGQVTLASGGRAPAGTVRRKAPGIGGGRSRTSVTGVRAAALVGMSALAIGSWSLTNHQPGSWTASAASANPQSTAPANTSPGVGSPTTGGTPPAAGGVTPTTKGNGGSGTGGGAAPTATTRPSGGGSGGGAAPTATPKPTVAPKPTVCATTTQHTTCP